MCNKPGLGTKDYLFPQVFTSKILSQHEWTIMITSMNLMFPSSAGQVWVTMSSVAMMSLYLASSWFEKKTPALISLHLCRMPCCHGAYYHLHHVYHQQTLAVTAKWSRRETGPKAAFLQYYQEKKAADSILVKFLIIWVVKCKKIKSLNQLIMCNELNFSLQCSGACCGQQLVSHNKQLAKAQC